MNDLPANPRSVSAHSEQDALSAHLFSLELALLDLAIRRDRARVEQLLADDFQEFGASGRVWSRVQILKLLESEPPRQIATRELACHPIAEDVALVTYRAVSADPQTHETLTTMRSSLWVRVDGQWKMRFHQGTQAV